jgi:hypothetical protein
MAFLECRKKGIQKFDLRYLVPDITIEASNIVPFKIWVNLEVNADSYSKEINIETIK